MPRKPKRPCSYPGCPNLTEGQYCKEHEAAARRQYNKYERSADVNKKYGNTVIMVTHNDAIKDMADRVVKLRDGMIRRNYQNESKIPAAELEW